jgi:Protein of unknown function (DUF2726)
VATGGEGEKLVAVEVIIFLAVLLGLGAGLILEKFRSQIDAADQRKLDLTVPALTFGRKRVPAVPKNEGLDRLRQVSEARFLTKRLMSDNEAVVLVELEAIIADLSEPWRVMPQVALTQIVGSNSDEATAAIEGQHLALLVVGGDRTPIAAVEYQPLGQIRSEDAVRDAVKREALRRSGIPYIEVRASDQPGDLRADVAALAARLAARGALAELSAEVQPAVTKPPRKPRGRPASGVKP